MSDEREAVRAWVARDEIGTWIGLYLEEPMRCESPNGVWWDGPAVWLPSGLFPTLAPGERWPVEIRRIAE